MYKKAVFPGKYIQGAGVIAELPALAHAMGKNPLVLASPSVNGKVLPACGINLQAHAIGTELFRGECCQAELQRLSSIVARQDVHVLVGMGGGKTIDTAKIVADRADIPVIIVPTIASTDAPCSGCAVQYTQDGVFDSVCYQKTNPAAVLVDLNIIAAAPTRFLVAGMGDALSTWFEARSCQRTNSPNECGGYSTLVGLHIARLCYETLLADGVAAKQANERHIVTTALDHIVEANTLLSGVGFESGGLAAAHAIHNGLTALSETHGSSHGEKVAFGVLSGLQLAGGRADECETVYGFCEQVGLPTTLADVGVKDASRERLMPAAQKACATGQSIHHEAGIITPEKVLDAMLAADAMGRARKSVTPALALHV